MGILIFFVYFDYKYCQFRLYYNSFEERGLVEITFIVSIGIYIGLPSHPPSPLHIPRVMRLQAYMGCQRNDGSLSARGKAQRIIQLRTHSMTIERCKVACTNILARTKFHVNQPSDWPLSTPHHRRLSVEPRFLHPVTHQSGPLARRYSGIIS
jgi:hypothetical protein